MTTPTRTPLGYVEARDPDVSRRTWLAGPVRGRTVTLFTQPTYDGRMTDEPAGIAVRNAPLSPYVLVVGTPLGGWRVRGRARSITLPALIKRMHGVGGGSVAYVLNLSPIVATFESSR